jgi:acyl-CoA synthetase (NDP forming)
MLMVGFGGVLVEVLKDVVLAPLPLDKDAALELLNSLEGAALLEANRGRPACDTEALVELMVRLSQFAADHAGLIAEIDLNPVIVHARGAGVSLADALIVTCADAVQTRAAE